ncbi:MAG: hypothetical protein OCC46_03285 [Pseudodesulfovibrio sp.]
MEKDKPERLDGDLIIKYEGKPIENHTFDTELYATSLLGFSQSFKRANKIIFGVDVAVEIRAEREGSLEAIIQFCVENQETASIINTYADLVAKTSVGAIASGHCLLKTYRFLLLIIKKAKGKRAQIEKLVRQLKVDQKLSQRVIKLLTNRRFRKSLDQLTYFLAAPEMEYIEIIQPGNDEIRINQEDRPFFVEQPEDDVSVVIDDTIVSIIYPSAQRTKWRFQIDGGEHWAEVTDFGFLKDMQDKPLEYFEGIQFSARVETTTIKRVDSINPEVSRKVFNFSLYTPSAQVPLL